VHTVKQRGIFNGTHRDATLIGERIRGDGMSLSFAIIGGGWYGCHIATSFRALGFSVTVFEQSHRLLHASSGNNQFRLHQGFHYPRHYGTRMQSREGFSRFVERYPGLSIPVPQNLYAVSKGESIIDYLTYKLIMTASGIEFTELATLPDWLANIEGCIQTAERVLLLDKARRYFTERLSPFLVSGHRVESIEERGQSVYVDGRRFDFVVDASWGHFTRPPIDLFYEPTMLLYYEANTAFPAVTLVDGPLCSIYPTEDPTLYTLSSVLHTPLGRFASAREATALIDTIDPELIVTKVARMEEHIMRYLPGFRDVFRFVGPQLAIKTKPTGRFDDRSCYVFQTGRVFSVMSGKIDTIFYSVERILSMIEAMEQESVPRETGGLRAEILDAAAYQRSAA
jgi:hypothetical protein